VTAEEIRAGEIFIDAVAPFVVGLFTKRSSGQRDWTFATGQYYVETATHGPRHLQTAPFPVTLRYKSPRRSDDNITDRRLVKSNSERGAAMDVSPNASVPGAGALDDVYSRIGIRPICRGTTKHARRYPGRRDGQLRLGSGGRHCHFGNCRLHMVEVGDKPVSRPGRR